MVTVAIKVTLVGLGTSRPWQSGCQSLQCDYVTVDGHFKWPGLRRGTGFLRDSDPGTVGFENPFLRDSHRHR